MAGHARHYSHGLLLLRVGRCCLAGPLLLRLGIGPAAVRLSLLRVAWVLGWCLHATIRRRSAKLRVLAVSWRSILLRWLILRLLRMLLVCGLLCRMIRLLLLHLQLLILCLLHLLLLILLMCLCLQVLLLLHVLLLVLWRLLHLRLLGEGLLRLRRRILAGWLRLLGASSIRCSIAGRLLLLLLRVRAGRQRRRPLWQGWRCWERRQRRRGPWREIARRQWRGFLGQRWRCMLLLLHPLLTRVYPRLRLLHKLVRWLLLVLLGCRRCRRRRPAAWRYLRLLRLLPGLRLHRLRGRRVARLLPRALAAPSLRVRLMGLPRILLRVVLLLLLHVLLLLLRGPAGRRLEGSPRLLRHRAPGTPLLSVDTPGRFKVSRRQ